jgi:nicotinamide-nucleotide amidase
LSAPPRAVVVVTGSELVRGAKTDANGPYLARELTRLGLEPGRLLLVGDRPEELAAAFAEGLAADLCVISGGLGPTHDDRTVELLAAATGRSLVLNRDLEREIEIVSRAVAARLGRPYDDFAAGVRKQASVPEGAFSLGLAGTAPALVMEHAGRAAVALPGPPSELRRLWPAALASEPVTRILARAPVVERRVLRLYGPSESAVARAIAEAGGERPGFAVTVCAAELEVEIEMVLTPGRAEQAHALERALEARFRDEVFARDRRSVAEVVLDLCRASRLRLATAESCTGGLVGARLTSIPGASDVYLGGFVTYSDEAKEHELAVPADVIEGGGAVSATAARAMAAGARAALGAEAAVAVTGIAGPGGATAEKPVGLVFLAASLAGAELAQELRLHGDREDIRNRATVAALHLLRRLLAQSGAVRRDSAA